MTEQPSSARYQRLFERLGDERARQLLDRLQVVALTGPDALRELEAFLDRAADKPALDERGGELTKK